MKHRSHIRYYLIAAVTAAVAGVVIGAYLLTRPHPLLPKDITRQANFGIYMPVSDATGYRPVGGTAKYNSDAGVLSFDVINASGGSISFSEQATPESFVDVPQVYDKLISSLQSYASFDSVNGKIALTLPKELRGGQTAVMNGRGTLLFARPTQNLTEDQWRQIFNNLQIVR